MGLFSSLLISDSIFILVGFCS